MRRFLMKRILAFVLGSIALFGAPATYDIDPTHSSVQFTVRHLMISNVKGTFEKLSGFAVYDPNDLASSKLDATVDASSVNTRVAKRDAQLKSADFFEVDKYPNITFQS